MDRRTSTPRRSRRDGPGRSAGPAGGGLSVGGWQPIRGVWKSQSGWRGSAPNPWEGRLSGVDPGWGAAVPFKAYSRIRSRKKWIISHDADVQPPEPEAEEQARLSGPNEDKRGPQDPQPASPDWPATFGGEHRFEVVSWGRRTQTRGRRVGSDCLPRGGSPGVKRSKPCCGEGEERRRHTSTSSFCLRSVGAPESGGWCQSTGTVLWTVTGSGGVSGRCRARSCCPGSERPGFGWTCWFGPEERPTRQHTRSCAGSFWVSQRSYVQGRLLGGNCLLPSGNLSLHAAVLPFRSHLFGLCRRGHSKIWSGEGWMAGPPPTASLSSLRG